jgi:formate dehydrogenase beta subunit
MPVVDKTFQSATRRVLRRRRGLRPEEHHLGGAHGHEAAVSIDKMLQGEDMSRERPPPGVNVVSQKMGIHEWSYDNEISLDQRFKVPHARPKEEALKDIKPRSSSASIVELALKEAQRCLNCDVQTVFSAQALHRVRRLRRHLPDGLHHLHPER